MWNIDIEGCHWYSYFLWKALLPQIPCHMWDLFPCWQFFLWQALVELQILEHGAREVSLESLQLEHAQLSLRGLHIHGCLLACKENHNVIIRLHALKHFVFYFVNDALARLLSWSSLLSTFSIFFTSLNWSVQSSHSGFSGKVTKWSFPYFVWLLETLVCWYVTISIVPIEGKYLPSQFHL